jgi:NTP pyrophosphatase (non-canonical NTP hydrolase)
MGIERKRDADKRVRDFSELRNNMKERHYCAACEQRANADGECQCKKGYAAIKTNEKNIFDDISKERERQFEKWGEQNHEPYKWLTVLGEEFGEACKGALENNFDNYREELVQVAAVAVAAIEAHDRKMEVKSE